MKSAPLSSDPKSPGVFVLAVFTLCFTACAPVQPWERGRLAQPQMALEADALMASMDDHTYTSKEAASGGIGPAGGGCGCN
jgi:hypothetical protein